MRAAPVRQRVRHALAWLHRWTGLAMLAFITSAALTGGVLAFRDELDRWINPELFVVVPHDAPASLDDVYALVEATYPGLQVSAVTFPGRPDGSLSVSLRAPQARRRQRGQTDALPFNTVFVDPYGPRVLGHRSSLDFAWTRAAIVPTLLRFHYTLLLQRPGVWVMGICAYLWLATSIVGAALAWPVAWHRGGWRRVLGIRLRGGRYRLAVDTHRALGVWLLPAMAVMAATSVYLAFPIATRSAITSVLPTTPSVAGRASTATAGIGPERALQRARLAHPAAEPRIVFSEPGNGWYSIRVWQPGDVAPYGDTQVYVAMDTGDLVATRPTPQRTSGDVVLAWLRPLHTGAAFGLPGRVAVALLGLGVAIIGGTSLYTWLHRRVRPSHVSPDVVDPAGRATRP